ncbi:major facilitator superfamily domain-containing protein [Microdochium trichocladiopsis]|uniref:Major facilitator superfamily domain-containing protein n=1 Tax=Microdochium trichocladiopsis TaxID=1682393 RepID=A0A9P8Y4Z2_9PEZI|nr:major facilitator superfamily domain-containing protein [Microdochium trichocladiopsis]KAH7029823.1 major facilitator superfamily domain-containing protein [Microdochium trichocladiopsis]
MEEGTTGDLNAATNAKPGRHSSLAVVRVVLVLVLGAFTANVDGSLVLATHPAIASEFNALSSSSWLFVAYNLAGAATQAMYGKLSDIYGRRLLLVIAYALFAVGCAIVGAGRSMGEVIVGRVVSGCGGSALNVLGILLITDLVPLREAASWQASINLAATAGRSLGGPVGGWLADTVGWRWSFMGQVPVFCLAILLCLAWLPRQQQIDSKEKPRGLARVDFLGAGLLALFILALLLPFELSSLPGGWSGPTIAAVIAAPILLGALFVLAEKRWAVEPIFPLEVLHNRDVVLAYLVTLLQAMAQLGLLFSVPLYFQVTQRVSNKVAGAYLIPAVVGNAIGALVAGIVIKRTGRYRQVLILATAVSSVSYLLMLLRWHGQTNVWESLYIFPGGLGTGMVQTATFVAIQATIDPAHKAAAMSGIFLVVTVGVIMGMAGVSAVTLQTMAGRLAALLRLRGIDEVAVSKIVESATSSIEYIDDAPPDIAALVVEAYVYGLAAGHVVSLFGAALAVVCCFILREHELRR